MLLNFLSLYSVKKSIVVEMSINSTKKFIGIKFRALVDVLHFSIKSIS